MQIRRINAETALVPTTGYSQALEVSGHTRMLFISGQIPVAADGSVPRGLKRNAGWPGAMSKRNSRRPA